MKRRIFFKGAALTGLGWSLISPLNIGASTLYDVKTWKGKNAKNIIFLVSDGMSAGTLNLADTFLQRKYGRHSRWISLYREQKVQRALMETASANSIVTDSAAASSSWGSGYRINNNALNIGVNGEHYIPILQKFKSAGKKVGCVTSVPITHATPAGFCINNQSRKNQAEIAEQYLLLRFDVMMGGGTEFFDPDLREDRKNMFAAFSQAGYQVARHRNDLKNLNSDKPVLGVFHSKALPYDLDRKNDTELKATTPDLAELTEKAIDLMSQNPNGFVLQVEGGKVDWAAHANDTMALIYDQLAFDKAIEVAIRFAEKNQETLVVITTDHGNSNPGLLYGDDTNKKFDNFQKAKHTNDWVLQNTKPEDSVSTFIERLEYAQNTVIEKNEAENILKHYAGIENKGLYNPYKLPFALLAEIQKKYTSVGWVGDNHTSDFVELAMYGPGSEQLHPFVKNTDLHNFMLAACQLATNP